MQRNSPFRNILVLQSDRVYCDFARATAKTVFPDANVETLHCVDEAASRIRMTSYDMLVTAVTATGGDVFEFLDSCTREPRHISRVVVLTDRHEPQVLATLGAVPMLGAFDVSSEPPEKLMVALRAATGGSAYWSDSLLALRWQSEGLSGYACPHLTPRERLVLSIIGDGCSDLEAANGLGLSAFTIQSVRRSLYRKLSIDNKGSLVRTAAQLGFVLITSAGVVRPGLSRLRNYGVSRS